MRIKKLFKALNDFGLTIPRVFLFLSISLSAAFFEGFGMAMFLPILEYIQEGRDVVVMAETSKLWTAIFGAFSFFGLRVNLASLLAVVLFLLLLRVLFMYVRQVYSAWISQEVLHGSRMTLFNAYLNAEYSLFDGVSTGHALNVITTETQRVGTYFSSLFSVISNGVVIVGYAVVLLWLSVPMTIFGLCFLTVGGLVVAYFIRHTKKMSFKTTASNEALSFLLVERLSEVRLLKLSAVIKREIKKMARASRKVRDNLFFLNKLKARVDLILEPFVVLTGVAILFTAVNFFNMALAQVGLFMLILLRLLPLSKEFLRSRQTVFSNSGSIKAVLDGVFEARQAEERESDGKALAFQGLSRGISFENVGFTYPGQDKPALLDINIFIPAGKTTALVGPSGAGKSTLIDLLPLLRRPQKGRILFDDQPSLSYDLQALRRGMAFVSQDAAILNDTVLANIAFARPDATDDEIWEAMDKARAKGFVESLPQGINTVLGERGTRLSGGQRQRLSLARALLENTPILILDEPTSALDSEVERDIQEAMAEMRREGNVTIIIIAHRMSTIRGADKIVVLQEGRVKQEGTHEELSASKEWYAMVNDLQTS